MQKLSTRRAVLMAGAALAASAPTGVAGQDRIPLKVMSFPGLSNFPHYAAEHKGLFDRQGLTVELLYTPNSTVQREGLARGDHQIIQTAADNSVAMVEMAKADAIIVTGGDNGFNRIIVQPEIASLADLRGRTVAVDAPNTAYALLLYKALKAAGLNKGDYSVNAVGGTTERLNAMKTDKARAAAAVMNVPFNFSAAAAGLKDLGSATAAVGAYQAGAVVVMRRWAEANSDALVRYIAAVVEGRRWLLDRANRAEAVQLLVDKARLPPAIAARAYDVVTDPVEGFRKDAGFDMEGFKNVLRLRAEIEGQWGGNPPAPDKYIDLSYYDKALAGL